MSQGLCISTESINDAFNQIFKHWKCGGERRESQESNSLETQNRVKKCSHKNNNKNSLHTINR